MAGKDKGAAVALIASAVLAPVTLPPGAEEIDHGDGTASVSVPAPDPAQWVSRIAELNTEFDEAKARASRLDNELEHERTRTETLRAEITETRERFQQAWDEREHQVQALLSATPRVETSTKRAPVADAQLVITLRGKRTVLMPGDLIPEGIDLATLPPGSFR